jgi:hypothetical protein
MGTPLPDGTFEYPDSCKRTYFAANVCGEVTFTMAMDTNYISDNG